MTLFAATMRQMFQRQPVLADFGTAAPRAPMGQDLDDTDAPESMPMIYRSEAFAEDLYDMQLA